MADLVRSATEELESSVRKVTLAYQQALHDAVVIYQQGLLDAAAKYEAVLGTAFDQKTEQIQKALRNVENAEA